MFSFFRGFQPAPKTLVISSEGKPFCRLLIKHWQPETRTFTPSTYVTLKPSLRTSGFWAQLCAEDCQLLLLLLTFMSPNGDCIASVIKLAATMRVSQVAAKVQMHRLTHLYWQERPLVVEVKRDTGLDAFALSSHLFETIELDVGNALMQPLSEPLRAAPREAVIAHSRAAYARPRAEVEQIIEQQLGRRSTPVAKTTARAISVPPSKSLSTTSMNQQLYSSDLLSQLMTIGMTEQDAQGLIERYESERIERQLRWLPYRNAHNPVRFLLAAIEQNYDAPKALKEQREREQQNASGME